MITEPGVLRGAEAESKTAPEASILGRSCRRGSGILHGFVFTPQTCLGTSAGDNFQWKEALTFRPFRGCGGRWLLNRKAAASPSAVHRSERKVASCRGERKTTAQHTPSHQRLGSALGRELASI